MPVFVQNTENHIDKKYMTALALSEVDESNIEAVREFVKKMGLEILNIFDEFWAKGDENRMKKLDDLRSVGLAWRKK